jgi:hypothetical protein
MATEGGGSGKSYGRRPLSVNSYILSLVDSVFEAETSENKADEKSEAGGASRFLSDIARGYEDQYELFLGGVL